MPPLSSRRSLLKAAGAFALLPNLATAQAPAASPAAVTAVAAGEWPLYGADLADTRAAASPAITAANVASLAPRWRVEVGGPISGTPVVVGATVYIGDYGGTLRALDLVTGASRWTYDTGARVEEPNLKINLGILGSAAVAGDTVYVGDATATVHALDAATGNLRWKTTTDSQKAASIWSSPVPWRGHVYVGVASISKEVGFRGSLVALDAASGKLFWQTYMVPEHRDGAGVFAVPVLDPGRNTVYVGTQNAYSAHPAPYGNPTSIVALDAETGQVRWAFNAPPNDGKTAPTADVAFSASPNLFTATVNGKPRDLIGEGQKSGVYWALDRDTGAVVWKTQVSPSGPLGGMEGTSAVAGTRIVVPSTNWPDPSGPAAGLVATLDAATGKPLWQEQRAAPVASPAAIGNDVVFQAGIDGLVRAYALADGRQLWQADLGASISGGIAVAGDAVVLGAATPAFAPFVRAGKIVQAFALGKGTPAA